MDFSPSERMGVICDLARSFVDHELIPMEGAFLHGTADELAAAVAGAQRKVRQLELWAPNHPVEYGGLDLSMVEHGLLSEVLGRTPLGHLVFGTQAPDAGNIEILHARATEMQRERFLRPLVEGRVRSCFSMTEPETAGSNPTLLATSARRDSDGVGAARGVADRHRRRAPPATRSRRSSSRSPTRCCGPSTSPSRCTARSGSPATRCSRTGIATSEPLASTTAPTRSTRRRSVGGSSPAIAPTRRQHPEHPEQEPPHEQ